MHVETCGRGSPLLFLHGAAEWIGYSSRLVDLLAQRHRVVQPEQQGHGQTPDRPGDLTYAGMTADTLALIDAMGLERPHLVGFSDGGIVAIEAAMQRPDRIGKFVAIGPNVSVSGFNEEARQWLREVTPDSWDGERVTRHKDWPAFGQKVIDMMRREPEIPLEQLARITTPALIIGADHDLVELEHLLAIHRAIRGSQLAIVPGATHELTVEQPELVAELALRFLGE